MTLSSSTPVTGHPANSTSPPRSAPMCPLFLIGGAVLGRGSRRRIVYPLPDFDPTWCVVATPPVGVSTPQAFRDWDALCASEGLTVEASEPIN